MSGASTRSWSEVGYSLKNSNFRVYVAGHGASKIGMWMQETAELWLILEMTGSGVALGVHSLLRFGPVLLFGAQAGLLIDRVERLKLLKLTQALLALFAAVIAVAALFSTPSLALIYVLVLAQGCVNAVDNPLRRGFVRDLAADDELSNAVSLNSAVATASRAVGPAVAGLLIQGLGVEWCFVINTISYGAVLGALYLIDTSRIRPPSFAPRGRGQIRAGLSYAWNHASMRSVLVFVAAVAMFGWNYNVLIPVFSTSTLGGSASLYGLMLASAGTGSFVAALYTARAIEITQRRLVVSGTLLVATLLACAVAPTVPAALVCLFLLGAAGTSVIVGSQAKLQLEVDDDMSGRLMALYSVAFVGSKPIGGLIGGFLTDLSSPRLAFAAGAVVVTAATLVLAMLGRRPVEGAVPTA